MNTTLVIKIYSKLFFLTSTWRSQKIKEGKGPFEHSFFLGFKNAGSSRLRKGVNYKNWNRTSTQIILLRVHADNNTGYSIAGRCRWKKWMKTKKKTQLEPQFAHKRQGSKNIPSKKSRGRYQNEAVPQDTKPYWKSNQTGVNATHERGLFKGRKER